MKKKSKISLLMLAVMLIGGLFFGFQTTLANNGPTIMVHIEGEPVNIRNFTIYYKLNNSSVEQTAVLVRDNDDQPFFGYLSFEGKVPSTIYAKGLIGEKEYNFTINNNGNGNPNGNGTLVYWAKVGSAVVQPPDEEKPPVEEPGNGETNNPPAEEPGSENPPSSGDNSGDETQQPGDTQGNQPGNTSDGTQSGTPTTTTTTPTTTQPQTTQVTQPAVQTLSTVSGGALPKTAGPWMNWLLLSGLLALGSSATLFMKFRKL